MGVVVFLDDDDGTSGGSDVTPDSLNWGNITATDTINGVGSNSGSEQTLAGIDAQITLRAVWTSTSSSPAKGQWIKNGAAVQSVQASPVTVNVSLGDKVYFSMSARNSGTAGNYDSGTVTVTNDTDGGASIDTFTFAVQYIYSGGSPLFDPLIPPGAGDTYLE